MSNVDPKLVRQEIDDLLTSGRLERLETVSAHIFQMFGREWRELTSSEVFIHVFHDSFDDVDKLLARDRYKLVFDFVPLSASFTFTCLSRKFVRLSLNKFERTAPAYGFGFSNLREMESFCAHLDRIRSYAKATLVPPVRSVVLGMSNLGLQSPSSTPPRVNIPYIYADNTPDIPLPLRKTSTWDSLSPVALNHSSSLYRDHPQFHQCSRTPFYSNHNNSMSSSDLISRHDLPCNDCISDEYSCAEPTIILPMCEAPDLSKVDLKQNMRKRNNENDGQPMSRLIAAEHRVRALIEAIQPTEGADDEWNHSTEHLAEEKMTTSSKAAGRMENPAGVIGSPVKGKGGAYASRRKTATNSWTC